MLFILLSFFACQSNQATEEKPIVSTNVKDKKMERESSAIKKLPPKQFVAVFQNHPHAILLDVRTLQEFQNGHIEEAVNLDISDSDFQQHVQALMETKQAVFVYCQKGGRSNRAATILQEMGVQEIYDLQGGYSAWQKAATVTLPDTLTLSTH